MNVRELIEELQAVDGDRIVVMSGDQEGNGYSPLGSIWECVYSDGEVGLETLTEDDIKHGYSEEDVKDGKPAVCLWPGYE